MDFNAVWIVFRIKCFQTFAKLDELSLDEIKLRNCKNLCCSFFSFKQGAKKLLWQKLEIFLMNSIRYSFKSYIMYVTDSSMYCSKQKNKIRLEIVEEFEKRTECNFVILSSLSETIWHRSTEMKTRKKDRDDLLFWNSFNFFHYLLHAADCTISFKKLSAHL